MLRKIIFASVLLPLIGMGQSPVFEIKFNSLSGNSIQETNTGKSLEINSQWKRELVDGLDGSALRFDGYTTYIDEAINWNLPTSEFSISSYLAVESYPVGEAGIVNILNDAEQKGFALSITSFGFVKCYAYVGGNIQTLESNAPLSHYDWHHVSFTFGSNSLKLYIDGNLNSSKNTSGNFSYPTQKEIKIGTHYKDAFAYTYNKNRLNGLLDEVEWFSQVLSSSQIMDLADLSQNMEGDLSIPDTRFEDDHHRPIYHAIPPAAWTNEPHGLLYFENKYHLFYQKNANGPYWSFINWGHLSSPDLVSWTEEKIALWPEHSYDKYGIWSGHAIIDGETPTIFYTGVDGSKAVMASATSDAEMINWEKSNQNPLIDAPPATYSHKDFRDPFIWQNGTKWNMIIGSGLNSAGSGGTVFWYESEDLENWDFIRPMLVGHPDDDGSGEFWEMPLFLDFNSKQFLLVNKTPVGNNPANALYWSGTLDGEFYYPDEEVPKQLELSNHMLAPCVFPETDSTYVAIGIIADLATQQFSYSKGWAHLFSLPRIWYKTPENLIGQKPHPSLNKLRGELVAVKNKMIDGVLSELDGFKTRHFEIDLDLDFKSSQGIKVTFGKNESGTEQTVLTFNSIFDYIELDKSKSSSLSGIQNGGKQIPFDFQKTHHINIFVDGSVVEVFIDDKHSFATRIFPSTSDANLIEVEALGELEIQQMGIYKMRSMHDPTLGTFDFLQANHKSVFYPNPSNGTFKLKAGIKIEEVQVTNQLGQNIDFMWQNDTLQINESGFYFVKIRTGNEYLVQKLIVK